MLRLLYVLSPSLDVAVFREMCRLLYLIEWLSLLHYIWSVLYEHSLLIQDMYFLVLHVSLRTDSKSSVFKGFLLDNTTVFPGSNNFC